MAGLNRYDPKRDGNEPAIRAVLRKAHVQTWQLSGEGIPDLLCLVGHHLFLMEVKAAKSAPLTEPQKLFRDIMIHANAGYYVVWDADGALDALRLELAR